MKLNLNVFISALFLCFSYFSICSKEQVNARMSHEIEELKIKNYLLSEENQKYKNSSCFSLKDELDKLKIAYERLEIKYFKQLNENESLQESINEYEAKIRSMVVSCDEEKRFLERKINDCIKKNNQ
ncbi:hypothetical protein EBU24_01200 [bacterium]|nr:hypothetical protein [bacterium]